MDKELMDKMNEALKANGKRELTLDEMDKVSGGFFGEDGNPYFGMSQEAFNDSFVELATAIGFNAAHQIFMEMTGYVTYAHKSPSNGDDADKMRVVLANYDNANNKGAGHH